MIKSILKIGFLSLLINFSFGQKNSFKTGKPSPKSYYVEIPYENVNEKIIIPVTIENKEYKFLFDTGAPNIISSKIFNQINSKIAKTISITDANQKKQAMQVTTIPQLRLGSLDFFDTGTLVFEIENNLVFNCFEIDGIIGTNMVRESIVQIRPREQLLVITNQKKSIDLNKEEAIDLILKGDQSSPNIKIRLIGNKKATETVLIDTGASGFYDLCKSNYNQLNGIDFFEDVEIGEGSSSIGMFGSANANEQYRLEIPELTIGNASFTNVTTITGDDDNSRIGSDILNYGNMTIDFKRKKFYFESFEKTNNLEEKLFGITPNLENNTVVIGVVWDNDLKDVIKTGDQIIELNDLKLENINTCELITKESAFKKNDTLRIRVNNGEEIKTLTLIRK